MSKLKMTWQRMCEHGYLYCSKCEGGTSGEVKIAYLAEMVDGREVYVVSIPKEEK